ncbi:MAG: hypothetical protein AABZ39_01295 [Spirochaetota bacterium]
MKRLRSFLRRNTLISSSIASILFSAIAGLGNYIIQVFTNRNLSAADFGDYTVLMGFLAIATMPITAVLFFVIRSVASSRGAIAARRIISLCVFFVSISLAAAAVLVLFSGWLARNMQIRSQSGFTFLAAIVVLSTVTTIVSGALFGRKKGFSVNASIMVSVIVRLLLTVIFVAAGFTFAFAMWSALLPYLVLAALFVLFLVRSFPGMRSSDAFSASGLQWVFSNIAGLLPLMAVYTICMAVMQIDVVLAKRFLSADDAGAFATVTILGKVLALLPSMIGPLLFARISAAGKSRTKRRHLRDTFLVNAFVVGGGLIFIALFARPLIVLQFTERYSDVAPLVSLYAVGAACLSFTNLFCNYLSACRKYWPLYVYIVFIAAFYLIVRGIHLSVSDLVTVSVLFQASILVFTAVVFFIMRRAQLICEVPAKGI